MLLPSIISLSVAAISSGFILSAIGYYTPLMLLGSTMTAIGFGFLTAFKPSTSHASWIGWQVMFGVGVGMSFPQPWSAMQTALAPGDIPLGMAGVGFAISIGAAIAISLAQNVFTNLLRQGLRSAAIPGPEIDDILAQGATGLLQHVPRGQKVLVIGIYNSAVTRCFWVGVAAACAGLVAAMSMNWNSMKQKEVKGGKEEIEKQMAG